MKILKKIALTATILAAGQAFAATVPVLGFPDAPGTYDQYGDFRSYSMPILDYFSGGQYMFNTSNTIQKSLVVGTGSGGNQVNSDLGLTGQVSNGFDFPNNVPHATTLDWSSAANGVWTIDLNALRQFLTFDGVKHDLIGYFNNNQSKANGDALDGTSAINLWAWAQISVTGSTSTQTFTLQNTDATTNSTLTHRVDPFGHGNYVLSGGPVTLCFTDASLTVEKTCAGSDPFTKTFQHNLGQNDVSYAIFSEGLNSLLWDTNYSSMAVRVDFLDLNNGYENLFFAAGCVNGCVAPPPEIPEPGTIALFGLALAGLSFMRYRKS